MLSRQVQQVLIALRFSDVENVGLVCHVDLFSAPASSTPTSPTMGEQVIQPPTQDALFISESALASSSSLGPQDGSTNLGYQRYNMNKDRLFYDDVTPESDRRMSGGLFTSAQGPQGVTDAPKHTQALVGNLFVQPVVIDIRGKRSLVFAFPVSIMIQCSSYDLVAC